ncbi:MAG: hypothetical protein Q9224_005390 [Gallowayella concinna]
MPNLFPLLSPVFAFILVTVFCPSLSMSNANYSLHALPERAEPMTGSCFEDTPRHPNKLDQVETAFSDALHIASAAYDNIDSDTTIFPNYFNEVDRANVKRVYGTILGDLGALGTPSAGNDMLGLILIQSKDTSDGCQDGTLAYTNDQNPDKPYIVLCPNAFKKKAIGSLKGAEDPETNRFHAARYILCETLEANGGRVSYRMNALGATLFHEYTHYDKLIEPIFSAPIIDMPDSKGYGPLNVYNNLDRDLAKLNADSYTYYALQVFWTEECHQDFLPPRAGLDDEDPDCPAPACRNRRKRKRNC